MSVTFPFVTVVGDPASGELTVAGAAPGGDGRFELNVSNVNAAEILERLGLDTGGDWPAGDIDPDELLGRALVAGVGRDDSGVAAVDDVVGPGVVTDCGRRAGYFEDRMGALVELAVEAKRRGTRVAWV